VDLKNIRAEAIAKLEYLLQQNGLISVELLKRDPFWDLERYGRFQGID